MKFQYECPNCGDEIAIEDGDKLCNCPCCKKQFSVDADAEFTEGRWRDLTQVREVQRG